MVSRARIKSTRLKVCRLQGCEDKSHGSQEEQNKVIYTAHEDYRLPEHKE